ncbi:MAG: hypothetical protein HRU19_01165 [Pseudobacteriovorax sp.]|nr:hypothetical protein [Pseudobacteriovorax sp.]
MKLASLVLILSLSNSLLAKSILVVRKASENFEEVSDSFSQEASEDFIVNDYVINDRTTYNNFEKKVRSVNPNALIVMDNQAVSYTKEYFKKNPKMRIPTLATMALNLPKVLEKNSYIAGIRYEAPGFSVINSYNFLTAQPLKRVGVFYRKSQHDELIENTKRQLKRVKIELVAYNVEKKGRGKSRINSFLRKKFKRLSDLDAIWVLADNVILNRRAFNKHWKPLSEKIPLICPLKKFVTSETDLCVFSAFPSHTDLGSQLAGMFFAVVDGERSIQEIGVESIIAVEKLRNAKKMKNFNIQLNPKAAKQIPVAE